MSVGTGDDPADPWVSSGASSGDGDAAATSAGAGDRHHAGWWRTRWPVVAVGVVALAIAAVVVLVRPDERPTATLAGYPSQSLPGAPATTPIQRWTLPLGTRDEVALVDDRVVVADADGAGFTGPTRITAYNVRSKSVLWEQEVADAVSLLVVDPSGTATMAVQSPFGPGDDGSRRLLAVSSEDGRVLWDRPPAPDRWVQPNGAVGVLLVVTQDGCELVDAITGTGRWDDPAPVCQWLDDRTLVAEAGREWEVRDLDGQLLLSSAAGSLTPPVASGDLLVTLQGRDVVAHDRSGERQWEATADEYLEFLAPLPGGGVAAARFDDAGQVASQRGWDGDGEPVDTLPEAWGWGLLVDGVPHILHRDGGVDATIEYSVSPLDADHGDRRPSDGVTVVTRYLDTGGMAGVTRHGVLVMSIEEPPFLELYTFPDLERTWSVPAPGALSPADFNPSVALTSSQGMVVLPADGDPLLLYAYS